jgi:hypothetical protein
VVGARRGGSGSAGPAPRPGTRAPFTAAERLGANGILHFSHRQHSKNRFFEYSTGPVSSQNRSVPLGMTESLRVARRGGEAEFRAVLGLLVIPNGPVRNFGRTKCVGMPKLQFNGNFVLRGQAGMKFEVTQLLLKFPENTCYTVAGVSSITLLQKSPCGPMIHEDPVPVPSATGDISEVQLRLMRLMRH